MRPQARDARISELEAQEKALTEVRERLSRSRDALTDDAFHAQDLLRAAAHRMRRSRAERGAVAPRRSGGGVVHMLSPLVDDAASVRTGNLDGVGHADARAGGAPAFGRHDEDVDRGNGNSNSDGDRTRVLGVPAYSRPPSLAFSVDDSSAAWGAGRVPPGRRRPYGGGGGGGTQSSSRLSASVPAPVWSGDRLGTSSSCVRSGLPARGRGPQDDDDEEEEEGQEEEGVEPEGAAAAAMEVLREVERMHVGGSSFFSRR